MKFEWDEEKNLENYDKHGLNFSDASKIFQGPHATRLDLREDYGEARWQTIGLLEERVVVLVYTMRNVDTYRLISLRRATHHEKQRFENATNRLGQG